AAASVSSSRWSFVGITTTCPDLGMNFIAHDSQA
ncbi:hypothetical protein NPIL_223501, partial [Nephila pilipes]